MSRSTPTPRQLFVEEVSRNGAGIDLGRAALLVAGEEYPQLSVPLYLARLDQMSEEVRDRLGEETAPTVVLGELLHTLFERRKLRGNREAYYDPRNSFLNDVLDRGCGIPLTLSIVLLEVGWRLGLPLEGVNFPGHFVVRYRGEAVTFLIDAFDGGALYLEDDAQKLLDRVYGGTVAVRPLFLRSASRRDMLTRLVTNLKGIYVRLGDDVRALAAVEHLLIVNPAAHEERRARGLLLARLGRSEDAARQLEAYLRDTPGAGDREQLRAVVRALRTGKAIRRGPPES